MKEYTSIQTAYGDVFLFIENHKWKKKNPFHCIYSSLFCLQIRLVSYKSTYLPLLNMLHLKLGWGGRYHTFASRSAE